MHLKFYFTSFEFDTIPTTTKTTKNYKYSKRTRKVKVGHHTFQRYALYLNIHITK